MYIAVYWLVSVSTACPYSRRETTGQCDRKVVPAKLIPCFCLASYRVYRHTICQQQSQHSGSGGGWRCCCSLLMVRVWPSVARALTSLLLLLVPLAKRCCHTGNGLAPELLLQLQRTNQSTARLIRLSLLFLSGPMRFTVMALIPPLRVVALAMWFVPALTLVTK